MKTLDADFKAWMDRLKLRAEIVGKALNVTGQTVRNWRASSIPKRKRAEVERMMAEWESNPSSHFGPRLVINATDQQFQNWNDAANHCPGGPKRIEEWARDGLNELAKEYFSKKGPRPLTPDEEQTLRAADEHAEYKVQKLQSGKN